MEKKYIIKLKENEIAYKTVNSNGCPMIGLLHPAPYTEPDLEQVRKAAYEKGFDAGRMLNNGKYEKGINDAWEAARKIIRMPEVDLLNLFTECYSAVCTSLQVFLKYDASECIEKIRQYEQEKEGELGIREYFKKGEEVIDDDGTKAVILVVSEDNYCQVYTENGCIQNWHIHTYKFHKTGKTHPEVGNMLENMRREEE